MDEPYTIQFAPHLMGFGFVVVPGAIPAKRVAEIGMAYDKLMVPSSSPDFRAGSTTDRRFFVDNRIAFEDVYQHAPLLMACVQLIGQSFKLSSLMGRTVRAGSPAQELHTDIARDCADAPMAAFILMLDAFTPARMGQPVSFRALSVSQMFHQIDLQILV